MGVPCVTTELVNRAIGARAGEQVLVASTPGEFAEHVVGLLASPERRAEVGAAGRELVRSSFSWEAVRLHVSGCTGLSPGSASMLWTRR